MIALAVPFDIILASTTGKGKKMGNGDALIDYDPAFEQDMADCADGWDEEQEFQDWIDAIDVVEHDDPAFEEQMTMDVNW